MWCAQSLVSKQLYLAFTYYSLPAARRSQYRTLTAHKVVSTMILRPIFTVCVDIKHKTAALSIRKLKDAWPNGKAPAPCGLASPV